MAIPDRATFENLYAGQAPWDIGKPQKPFVDVAGQITGSILDAGCGTGDAALFSTEATLAMPTTARAGTSRRRAFEPNHSVNTREDGLQSNGLRGKIDRGVHS